MEPTKPSAHNMWGARAKTMEALTNKAKEQQLPIMRAAYHAAEEFATFCRSAVARVGGEPELMLRLSKNNTDAQNAAANELVNKAIATDENFLEKLWDVALGNIEEAKEQQADLLARNLRDMHRDFG